MLLLVAAVAVELRRQKRMRERLGPSRGSEEKGWQPQDDESDDGSEGGGGLTLFTNRDKDTREDGDDVSTDAESESLHGFEAVNNAISDPSKSAAKVRHRISLLLSRIFSY